MIGSCKVVRTIELVNKILQCYHQIKPPVLLLSTMFISIFFKIGFGDFVEV